MKLPSLPFFQEKEKPQYLLSLVLRNEKANAFIFEKVSGQISVISENEEYFENSIETATLEELLDVCDKVISSVEESLTPDDGNLLHAEVATLPYMDHRESLLPVGVLHVLGVELAQTPILVSYVDALGVGAVVDAQAVSVAYEHRGPVLVVVGTA